MELVGGEWCSGGAGGLGDPFDSVVVGFLGVPVVGGLVLWFQPMVRVCSARVAVRVIEVGPEVVRSLFGSPRAFVFFCLHSLASRRPFHNVVVGLLCVKVIGGIVPSVGL
jgi:hypothetical protein